MFLCILDTLTTSLISLAISHNVNLNEIMKMGYFSLLPKISFGMMIDVFVQFD